MAPEDILEKEEMQLTSVSSLTHNITDKFHYFSNI